jgi:hypothetical protein
MRIINLPKWLEPTGRFDLIRLGRDRDGGYLVDSRDVAQTDVLISLGISDDWSFEQDFVKRRNVPLHAFDGTVDRRFLAKNLMKSLISGKDLGHRFRAWRDYGKFFTGDRRHHITMVGLRDSRGFKTLGQIFKEYLPSGKAFLKIDVEGWEYRIFNDILIEADRISGLAIEFHNIDLHDERIAEFVEQLPLRVAHVHQNSYAPVSDVGVPLVIEVTFSSHPPVTGDAVRLPHALDRLSAPSHEPTEIRFID